MQKSLLDDAAETATKIVQERNIQLEKDLEKQNNAVTKLQAQLLLME